METTDEKVKEVLRQSKTIAIVGISPTEGKPSNVVARYLIAAGYTVIPVNPQYDEMLERKCYKTLTDIPGHVDIVDIFMRSERVLPVVEEAARIKAGCIWLQLGIINEDAKRLAESHGIPFFMNVCTKQEYARLIAGKQS
jgi:uncharacterized protein